MSYGLPAIVTETGVAIDSRCQVQSAAVSADGLQAYAKLYNGQDAFDDGDPPFISIGSDSYQWVSGSGGMIFSDGVYVVMSGDAGVLTIEYDQGY